MIKLVYEYGMRGHDDLPDGFQEQLWLAHRFHNSLVALRHRYERELKDLWSRHPEVAAIERELGAALENVDALEARAREEHIADRSVATRPDTAAELRETRARLKELRIRRRHAIAEVYPLAKTKVASLAAAHKAAVTGCRQQYSAEGLYWPTYNAVLARHHRAVRRVERRRQQGMSSALRFRLWEHAGAISVQLQREHGASCLCSDCAVKKTDAARKADPSAPVILPDLGSPPIDPPRSPELLASGEGPWRNVFQIAPWRPPDEFDKLPRAERRRIGRTGEARFAIGGGRQIALPIIVHRMLPSDAEVVSAELVVEQLAGRPRARLCVTAKVPDPQPVRDRHPVALHLGWRRQRSGDLRVATWASIEPMEVPTHLLEVLRQHDGGRWGEIVLPASWLEVAERPAALRSVRDAALEPVKHGVVTWLKQNPQPESDEVQPLAGTTVFSWKAARRFARLARQWSAAPPVGDGVAEITRMLATWRRKDRRLWQWEENERDQIAARRDNAWRQIGSWLGQHAGLLAVDNTDLASLRRKGDVADDSPALPGMAAQKSRARANFAAPGELRERLRWAAVRRGVTVRKVDVAYVTRTHRDCGYVAEANSRYGSAARVTCPECGRVYDQDENAARLILDRVLADEQLSKR